MDVDDGAVQGHGFDLHTDDLGALQLDKDAIQYPALRPPIHTSIDGMPVAELHGQAVPFAPVLGDVQDGVQHLPIAERYVAAWCRETSFDLTILGSGEFHGRSIS